MTEEILQEACKIIEGRLRSIGEDCEVIFIENGDVQIAPFSWSGCCVGKGLYSAMMESLSEVEGKL